MLKSWSVILPLMSVLAACATLPVQSNTSHIVVLGRLSNQTYEPVGIEDDILGHGWISAELSIDRVIEGEISERRIPVRYFSHAYYREDKSMKFRLKRTEEGKYVICVPKGQTGVRCDS